MAYDRGGFIVLCLTPIKDSRILEIFSRCHSFLKKYKLLFYCHTRVTFWLFISPNDNNNFSECFNVFQSKSFSVPPLTFNYQYSEDKITSFRLQLVPAAMPESWFLTLSEHWKWFGNKKAFVNILFPRKGNNLYFYDRFHVPRCLF